MKRQKSAAVFGVACSLLLSSLTAFGATGFTPQMAMADARNTTAVWKQEQALPDLADQYTKAVNRAKDMNTEKVEFTNPFTHMKQTIVFDNRTQIYLQIQKFVLPEQLKVAWQNTYRSITITQHVMEDAALELYAGLFAAQQDVTVKKILADTAKYDLSTTKLSHEKGLVTQQDYLLSEWANKKAIADLATAERNLRQIRLSYLSAMNLDPDKVLPEITPETISIAPGDDIDTYVDNALDNRIELYSLREEIRLKKMELEIYTYRNGHILMPEITRAYERTALEIEQAEHELMLTEFNIEMEIRQAWQAVRVASHSIEVSQIMLDRQKNQLSRMEALVAAGSITQRDTEELNAAVVQIENSVILSRLNLDNMNRKFRNATNFGPAFK